MKKLISMAIIALSCLGIALFSCSCAVNPKQKTTASEEEKISEQQKNKILILTIGTADRGGTMYPVGSAIAEAISSLNDNIKINISASNGSRTNVMGIMDGQIDMGLVSGDVAFSAYEGTDEFSGKPAKKLRAIAAVYSSLSNWMAPVSEELYYVHELEGKKIAVGPQDSTTELSARIALDVLGLDATNTIFKNYGLGAAESEVVNGNLDAVHGFAGIPIHGLEELSRALPCRLLKYREQELEEILAQNPFYYKTVIPAGSYTGQETAINTFGVKCLICVSEDMDENLVYTLTKSLAESVPQLTLSHETVKSMEEKDFMCSNLPIPLHPGAEQYYKETGYLE